jgi:hypothetical protein
VPQNIQSVATKLKWLLCMISILAVVLLVGRFASTSSFAIAIACVGVMLVAVLVRRMLTSVDDVATEFDE